MSYVRILNVFHITCHILQAQIVIPAISSLKVSHLLHIQNSRQHEVSPKFQPLPENNDLISNHKNVKVNSASDSLSHAYEYCSIEISGSTLELHSSFGNDGYSSFGGVLCASSSSIYIRESSFQSNQAVVGSHLFSLDSCLVIHNSTFAKGMAHHLGSIFIGSEADSSTSQEPLNVYGSVFQENRADIMGGAIAASNACMLSIRNTIFFHNSAGTTGGAIFGSMTSVYCSDCVFNENFIEKQRTSDTFQSFQKMLDSKIFSRAFPRGGSSISIVSNSEAGTALIESYTDRCCFQNSDFYITGNYNEAAIKEAILLIGSNSFYRSYIDRSSTNLTVNIVSVDDEPLFLPGNIYIYDFTINSDSCIEEAKSKVPISFITMSPTLFTMNSLINKIEWGDFASTMFDSSSLQPHQTSTPTTPMTRLPYRTTQSYAYEITTQFNIPPIPGTFSFFSFPLPTSSLSSFYVPTPTPTKEQKLTTKEQKLTTKETAVVSTVSVVSFAIVSGVAIYLVVRIKRFRRVQGVAEFDIDDEEQFDPEEDIYYELIKVDEEVLETSQDISISNVSDEPTYH